MLLCFCLFIFEFSAHSAESVTYDANHTISTSYRIIKGTFSWCATMESDNLEHYVRVNSAKKDSSIELLVIKFEQIKGHQFYTLRHVDSGFDFQHSVDPTQTTFVVNLNKETTKGLDLARPFYLYSMDRKYRSAPIIFTSETSRQPIGETEKCAICLNLLNVKPQQDAMLFCGHVFHNKCLILSGTNQKKCYACSSPGFIYKGLVKPKSTHYFNLKCPLCFADSI
jgi:hypothetical protein